MSLITAPLDANDSHLEIDQAWQEKPIVPVNFADLFHEEIDQAWQGKPIVPVNLADLFHYTFSLNLLLLLR